MTERYRLYREHKYMLFMLTEFERLIAKTDFTKPIEIDEVEKRLKGIIELLKGHAQHEDLTIHQLLRDKHSDIMSQIEMDHQQHEVVFKQLQNYLDEVKAAMQLLIMVRGIFTLRKCTANIVVRSITKMVA